MKWISMIRAASLLGALALLPGSVNAAAPESFSVDPSALEGTEPLELIDRPGHALPIAVLPRAPQSVIADPLEPKHLGDWILYVNYDGGTLGSCGSNSPQQNCSSIFPGTVLPYSGDAGKRASIIQLLRKRFEAFGITVTDVRPGSGDYDMEMVGNWQGVENPGFAGIAPGGDCWNNGGGEISFTLEAAGTTDGMAEIILQEVGHTWGLDHVDDKTDLLFPTTEGQNKTFTDQCLQVVANTDLQPTDGFCSHHVEACGSFSLQNSHQELLLIFGESVPDTTAPIVQILAPPDGSSIEGDAFDLTVGFADDQKPAVILTTITIESDALPEPIEQDGAFASPAELTFPITGLPDGTYTITVDGRDESDNPASDTVMITLEGSGVGGESDGSSDGGTSGGGSDGGTDGSGSSDGGFESSDSQGSDTDDSAPEDTDDSGEGCACRSTSVPTHPAMWLLPLLLAGPVRRRPAR